MILEFSKDTESETKFSLEGNQSISVFVNGKEIRRGTSGADLGDYFDPAAFARAVEGK